MTDDPLNPERAALRERMKQMTREEVIDLVRIYDFRDDHGHPLEHCSEFLALVDLAKGFAAPGGQN